MLFVDLRGAGYVASTHSRKFILGWSVFAVFERYVKQHFLCLITNSKYSLLIQKQYTEMETCIG